jgi:hypothetical protein
MVVAEVTSSTINRVPWRGCAPVSSVKPQTQPEIVAV